MIHGGSFPCTGRMALVDIDTFEGRCAAHSTGYGSMAWNVVFPPSTGCEFCGFPVFCSFGRSKKIAWSSAE